MGYAFISYAREDRAFVKRLVDDLRAAGIDTWTDLEQIPAGASWEQEIEAGLLGASALLYVSSQHSRESPWVQRQAEAALRRDIKIIPIVIPDVGAEQMPLFLQQCQRIDFRQDYDAGLSALIAGLRQIQTSASLPAAEPKSKGYAFISYAEEDQRFVQELADFMKRKGYGLWEFQSADRNYSADLYDELESVIREAAATLCIVSPHWKKSRVTKQEFLFSQEIGVPIFVLRVADPGPTLALSGFPYIDFSRDEKDAFGKLERELKRKGL